MSGSSTSLAVRLLKWLGWESALLPHFAHEYPRNSCSAVSPPSLGSGLSNGAILTDIFKQEIERLFAQIDAVWASTLPLKLHPQHKMALSIQKTPNSHQFFRFRCTQLCLHTSRPRADETLTSLQEVRRFRVGGYFYHSSPNKRSSSVMDRPPERRGAFGWTNFWVQLSPISGQSPITASHNTRWRRSDAGQPPFARFWLFSSTCWGL